jgi:plastocyanin
MRIRILRMIAVSIAVSCLVVLHEAAPASQQVVATGSIRGRVDIRRVPLTNERRPGVAELSSRPTPDTRELSRAVVFLDAVSVPERSPLRIVPRGSARARMDQRNETFMPHVLDIDAGMSVDFPNNDQTFHNVFSLSKTRRFDLGRYGRGKSGTVRFDRPGIVRVFCDIHSHMSAYVLVFNHSFHTTTDDDRRYRIDNIPPGTFTVHAWHEGATRDMRPVTLPQTGGVIDVDLLVQ